MRRALMAATVAAGTGGHNLAQGKFSARKGLFRLGFALSSVVIQPLFSLT